MKEEDEMDEVMLQYVKNVNNFCEYNITLFVHLLRL